MQFTSTAMSLTHALSTVSTITPMTASLAAYTGVLVEVNERRVTLKGSNGDTTITANVKGSDLKVGSVLLPPKPLSLYLQSLDPKETVTLTSETSTELKVQAGSSAPYSFTALSASFPSQNIPRRDKIEVDFTNLDEAVKAVKYCAETTGQGKDKVVQLVSDSEGLKLNSTDGFRLAQAQVGDASGFGKFDGLVALKVLELIAQLNPTHVQVDPKGREIVFHTSNVTVSTRLSQDTFPNVSSILGAQPPYSIDLDKHTLHAALRSLSAVAVRDARLVLKVVQDTLELSIYKSPHGSGLEMVELEQASDAELTLALNFDYFRSALEAQSAAQIKMQWSSAVTPVFLSSEENLKTIHVVMPVKAENL